MELKTAFENFSNAVSRLKEAYDRAKISEGLDEYPFFRDSTIQRFEFTVETFWKLLKVYLSQEEGRICNSPKSCIREMMNTGYFDENLTLNLLQMIDDRNMTSHTYHEEIAENIFSKISKYLNFLERIKDNLETRIQ